MTGANPIAIRPEDGVDAATFASEEGVIRKISRHLTWFLFLLYIVSYLDRINIGFAALSMNRDLGLTAAKFGAATTIFSIGYLFFEIPSNLMLARLGARVWIPRIMVTWGIASAATMFATGAVSLYILRFILGTAEAGFLAGVILYISYFFPPSRRGRITGFFVAASALTIAIGSPISGLILGINGFLGLTGWRWLFLLEGLPAIVLGVIAYFYLADHPRSAKWLDATEKELFYARLAREQSAEVDGRPQQSVWRELRSANVLLLSLTYFALLTTVNTNAVWSPQIVAEMMKGSGYFAVGLVNAIPALVTVVVLPIWCIHSDRKGERVWHTVAAFALAALGWLIVLGAHQLPMRVLGLICMSTGSLTALGVFWTIPSSVMSNRSAPAGIALISSIGIVASIVTPLVIGALKDWMNNFTGGVLYTLAFMLVAIVALLMVRQRPATAGT